MLFRLVGIPTVKKALAEGYIVVTDYNSMQNITTIMYNSLFLKFFFTYFAYRQIDLSVFTQQVKT